MSTDILNQIVAQKLKLIKVKESSLANLKANLQSVKHSRYHLFRDAISQPGQINLIAEIKKASPSQGLIRADFNCEAIARIYIENGASAISVLTEESFFLGKPAYLKSVSTQFSVPTLMKDFIVHEYQLFEAFNLGASAVLLIAAILPGDQIKKFLAQAEELSLDCLVEIHNKEELNMALDAGAAIIGINNRDLKTFEVDLNVCQQLIPRVPKGKIIVAESGIKTHSDVQDLQRLGAHAVLIGETFMRAKDIAREIKAVMHGQS